MRELAVITKKVSRIETGQSEGATERREKGRGIPDLWKKVWSQYSHLKVKSGSSGR